MNPVVVVLAAGLQERHAHARHGREAIGHKTTGRAGTDHNEVEIGCGHSPARVPAASLACPSLKEKRLTSTRMDPFAPTVQPPTSVGRGGRFGRGRSALYSDGSSALAPPN